MPDAARLDHLKSAGDVLAEAGIDSFAFAPQLRAVMLALATPPPIGVLESEYVRLFMAGTDGALCPPIESRYVGADAAAGGVAAQLQGAYRDAGLDVAPCSPFTPDHVATEFEFMACLCERERWAWRANRLSAARGILERERTFLANHLGRWIPPFARRVGRVGGAGLYPALAAAADSFVHHDRELVQLLTAELRDAG